MDIYIFVYLFLLFLYRDIFCILKLIIFFTGFYGNSHKKQHLWLIPTQFFLLYFTIFYFVKER